MTAASTDERPVVDYECLAEITEELASALHDHNIGRDIRGWRDVSELPWDVAHAAFQRTIERAKAAEEADSNG